MALHNPDQFPSSLVWVCVLSSIYMDVRDHGRDLSVLKSNGQFLVLSLAYISNVRHRSSLTPLQRFFTFGLLFFHFSGPFSIFVGKSFVSSCFPTWSVPRVGLWTPWLLCLHSCLDGLYIDSNFPLYPCREWDVSIKVTVSHTFVSLHNVRLY